MHEFIFSVIPFRTEQNGNTHAHLVNAHHNDDSMAKPPYIYPCDPKIGVDRMTCCKIWSGIVSYGLGADNSLPHCHGIQMIAGGQVAAGISDPWAEISGIIVMVRRSGDKSRGTATGFFFFPVVCLLFLA